MYRRRYSKDDLMHQSFTEKKRDECDPRMICGPFVLSFCCTAVNCGGSARGASFALTSQSRSAGGRWQQYSLTGLDCGLLISEFDSLFQLK